MTEFRILPAPARPVMQHRKGIEMLLHEALARARHQDALADARQRALVRQATAGRTWAALAGFAARRAAHARAAASRTAT